MKFINLTPHDVVVILADGASKTFNRDGTVARVNQTASVVQIVDGVSISTVRFGDVVGLPEPVTGTMFIVSALVKSALAGRRTDVVSPGDLVRDANGNVIGCKGFFC